jgi:mRNA interferase RelE/StbE
MRARSAASLCVSEDRYELVVAPTARRQLAEQRPEAVAFAAYEFIIGPLLDNPGRVGKQLSAPLDDRHSARRGTYRVIYRIDEEHRTPSLCSECSPLRRLRQLIHRPKSVITSDTRGRATGDAALRVRSGRWTQLFCRWSGAPEPSIGA